MVHFLLSESLCSFDIKDFEDQTQIVVISDATACKMYIAGEQRFHILS